MTYSKPDLPNPGEGRYWTITFDGGYYKLSLMEDRGNTYLAMPTEVTSAVLLGSIDTDAKTFEDVAKRLLDETNKASAFVGEYTFEENK